MATEFRLQIVITLCLAGEDEPVINIPVEPITELITVSDDITQPTTEPATIALPSPQSVAEPSARKKRLF